MSPRRGLTKLFVALVVVRFFFIPAESVFASAHPTRTFIGPTDFTLRDVSLTTSPHGGFRTASIFFDRTNRRLRVDRAARGSHPASTAYAFYDKRRIYIFSEGVCQVLHLSSASSILPTLRAKLPASFWDPYGNLGVLRRVGAMRIPYLVDDGHGMLEPAGRKPVRLWRQRFPGGAIEFGLADGDSSNRPYFAKWRSKGQVLKLRGGAFASGTPDSSVFNLPTECG